MTGAVTDVLRDEHAVILRALQLLEGAAARQAAGAAMPDAWWTEVVDWLRTFADRSHHAKEELALFPAMAEAGVPVEGGPIGVMLREHEEGRALVRAMASGDAGARVTAAHDFVALLRAHIDKENEVLFPIAESILDDAQRRTLARHFADVDADRADGDWQRAAALLARLDESLAARA